MIRVRLLVSFVLVALLPVIGVSIGSLLVNYYNGRSQSIDRLESVAARKELAISGWMASLHQELLTASQADYAPNFVANMLRLSNEGLAYPWYKNLVRRRLQRFVEQSSQFKELFLVDAAGRVVVSTNLDRENRQYLAQPVFRYGRSEPTTQLPFPGLEPGLDDRFLVLSDQQSAVSMIPVSQEGEGFLGVLGGSTGIDPLYIILEERTGLGQTGAAFLVNPQHAVLGDMGGAAQAAGPLQPPAPLYTQGVNAALQTASSGSGIYSGADGASVIGVYRWLPATGLVLAVEQDLSEAFQAAAATLALNLAIALVAIPLAVAASLLLARSIANPITRLAETASQVAQGNLDQVVEVEREDEIGALAAAFNSMTRQLKDLIGSLEQRVERRTHQLQHANADLQQRALQLQTSAQVGREITSILDIDVLLRRIVDLIQEAFGYYHVLLYLVDEDGRQLTLKASSGDTPVEHTHISLDAHSVNAEVAHTAAAVINNDVLHSQIFLYDHQLPETRSELVIPLRLGEQVIGTLDVQASHLDAFSEEDLLVIQSLGDQVVVAIENAHLYDQSRTLAVFEERNRLARELHDSVTQSLYSVTLLTEGWRRMIATQDAPPPEDYLNRINEITQQALREMRLLIYELRPPALQQDGLVGALQKRVDAVEQRVGIEARVIMEDFFEPPPEMEQGLYRIAQEALNNALKHSGASKVMLRIYREQELVVLEVVDNGRGFNPASAELLGGMGLSSMRERARKLDGELTIHSSPGDGARVTVRLPLHTQPTPLSPPAER
jgi:signal transduction histidine kinase